MDNPANLFERVVGLIPHAESDEDAIPAHAEDGIASAAYAFQAAAGLDDRAAGFAAEVVTNTLDNFVQNAGIDINAPDGEREVWEHPLVVAEVNRRRVDLDELANAPSWDLAVEAVRARASGVSALPLDQLDQDP